MLVISPNGVPRACEAARGWGITVIEHPVRLEPLLTECDGVISHGGMGLTSMALHGAKPLLLLPEHMEQAILAYRLGRQGLAAATIRFKDKKTMHRRVQQLLFDADLRVRAGKFALRYKAFTPSQAVKSVIKMMNCSPDE